MFNILIFPRTKSFGAAYTGAELAAVSNFAVSHFGAKDARKLIPNRSRMLDGRANTIVESWLKESDGWAAKCRLTRRRAAAVGPLLKAKLKELQRAPLFICLYFPGAVVDHVLNRAQPAQRLVFLSSPGSAMRSS
jgi:hypothetical protein